MCLGIDAWLWCEDLSVIQPVVKHGMIVETKIEPFVCGSGTRPSNLVGRTETRFVTSLLYWMLVIVRIQNVE